MNIYLNDDNSFIQIPIEFNLKWVTEPLDLTDSRDRFITLQFNPLQYELNNFNVIFKNSYWLHHKSKEIKLEPQLGKWEGKDTISSILNHLYNEEGRFSQESMTEKSFKFKQMRYLNIIFYSFSDVVSLLGQNLGNYLTEKRQAENKLLLSEVWVKLPHLIRDNNTNLGWPLNIRLVDWYDIDYSSLVEICRTSNIEVPSKGLIEKYKGLMALARMSSAKRSDLLKAAISNITFPYKDSD